METDPTYIVTPVVARLREFLARPGERHAFLIGPPGVGKTAALRYLAVALRAENHLVVMIGLGEIDTGAQLFISIGRALLGQSAERGNTLAALDQIRSQFD
jgi:stage III sporulation protein SpoIIIAA